VLGLTVFGLITNYLWPVKALDRTRAKLGAALRTLAKLAGLPDETRELTPRLTEAYELRLQAYQEFRAVHELLAGARFEPGEEFRDKLKETSSTAERLLMYLLAMVQHRPDLRPEAVPERVRTAASRLRNTLAEELQILGDRVVGADHRPNPDLKGALVELEHEVDSEIGAIANADVVAQIRARLALWQEAVPLVLQIARLKFEQ
jgi:hypothetical protein